MKNQHSLNLSLVERVNRLESKVRVKRRLRESLNSKEELKAFLIKNVNYQSIAGANPQGLPGEVMLSDCGFNDPHFVAENVFSDLENLLGEFTFSGFSCDFDFELADGRFPDSKFVRDGDYENIMRKYKIISPELSYASYDGDVYFNDKSIKVRQFKNETYEEYPFNWGFFYLTHVNGTEFTSFEEFEQNFLKKSDLSKNLNFIKNCVNGEVKLIGRNLIIDGDADFSGKLKGYRFLSEFLDTLKIKSIIKVTGDFDASNNNFTSIIGFPKEIGGNLDVSNNNIESFVYATDILENVGGDFIYDNNPIESFAHIPEKFSKNLEMKLSFIFKSKSVKIVGKVVNVTGDVELKRKLGNFRSVHDYLKSNFGLDKFGIVSGDFDVSQNKLETLYGCPSKCTNFDAGGNQLKNLKFCPEVSTNGSLSFYSNNLISLKGIKNTKVFYLNVSYNKLNTLTFAPKEVSYMFSVDSNPGNFTEDEVLRVTRTKYVH